MSHTVRCPGAGLEADGGGAAQSRIGRKHKGVVKIANPKVRRQRRPGRHGFWGCRRLDRACNGAAEAAGVRVRRGGGAGLPAQLRRSGGRRTAPGPCRGGRPGECLAGLRQPAPPPPQCLHPAGSACPAARQGWAPQLQHLPRCQWGAERAARAERRSGMGVCGGDGGGSLQTPASTLPPCPAGPAGARLHRGQGEQGGQSSLQRAGGSVHAWPAQPAAVLTVGDGKWRPVDVAILGSDGGVLGSEQHHVFQQL